MSIVTVGIVGVGCVGSAALKYYSQHPSVDAMGYDKFKDPYTTTYDKLLEQSTLFLCLPTLYSDELHQYDKSAIHEMCGRLNESRFEGVVVIKSTVEPGTTENLSKIYDCLDFAHNPEFLTARTAYEDFAHQTHVVLGKTKSCTEKKFKKLEQVMRACWPDARYSFGSSTETETMKSFCNCFYAQKISIFNEYYLMCQHLGMDYQNVLGMMLQNGWINKMHTNVPGPDGKMGYGGMCFPKDTSSLFQYLKREKLPHRMIESSVEENREIRYSENDELIPDDKIFFNIASKKDKIKASVTATVRDPTDTRMQTSDTRTEGLHG